MFSSARTHRLTRSIRTTKPLRWHYLAKEPKSYSGYYNYGKLTSSSPFSLADKFIIAHLTIPHFFQMLPKHHTSPASHPNSSSPSLTISIRRLQPVSASQPKGYTHCTALSTRKSVFMKAAKCLYAFCSKIGLQQILSWIGNQRNSSRERDLTFLRKAGEGGEKGGIVGNRDRIIREATCRKWNVTATASLLIRILNREDGNWGDVGDLSAMISGLLEGGDRLR